MDTSIGITHQKTRMSDFPDILLSVTQNSHKELVDQVKLIGIVEYLHKKDLCGKSQRHYAKPGRNEHDWAQKMECVLVLLFLEKEKGISFFDVELNII